MDLASIIIFASQVNADPTTQPDPDVEPEVTETVIGRNLPPKVRAIKSQHVKGKRGTRAPIQTKTEVVDASSTRGTLNATAFLLALRDAGKRSFESVNEVTGEVISVIKVDHMKVREDTILAIHSFMYEVRHGVKVFIGYDTGRGFGEQEQEARALANRELRGVPKGPTRQEQRQVYASVAGYVAGIPQPAERIQHNLQAREVLAVETMLHAPTPQERLQSGVVLQAIQSTLEELGVEKL